MQNFQHRIRGKVLFQVTRPYSSGKHSQGVALIVVLFAVALVSIVVLAYFNLALLNRNISFSSAGQARANILALSALNFIKGDFIAEIQSGSTQEIDPTGANVPIYVPLTNATMVPYRMTSNITFNAAIPANLIKWSSGSVAFWTNTASYGSVAGPKRAASGISTATSSINGRYIGNSRWTKPAFSTSATFQTAVVPEWVFMTRRGPLTNTSTAISLLANSASTNSSYVVGRYAYVVYDEGGLLDITAAGFSSNTFLAASPTDATDVGRKGSQGFADTGLQGLGLTSAQVEQLGGWRNASSWTSTNAYVGYLTTNAPASGFLQPAPGDQTFLSRQDLINYWTNQLTGGAASMGLLTNITTFSREKNAPSWGPEHDANDTTATNYWSGSNTDLTYDSVTFNDPSGGISYQYHSNQDAAASNNRFFPNVRVKTVFTRLSNEQAVVGEPLVKNRFDLSKLAWITYTGVPPTGVTYQDIYNYFGLVANFSGTTFVNWTYDHSYKSVPSSSTVNAGTSMIHIFTLFEVASLSSSLAREPDFFELLQAGILRGSLGLCSGDPTVATIDSNATNGGEFYRAVFSAPTLFPTNALNEGGALYRPMNDDSSAVPHVVNAQAMDQVIQIGANIIDQSDSDNFPTEIILNGDHFYGVENLPYISGVGDAALRVADASPPAAAAPYAMTYDVNSSPDNTISGKTLYQQYVHRWLDFALWNPHQNAKYPPAIGPTDIRILVVAGQEYPSIVGLGSATPSAGTDFSGRIFQTPATGVTVASANSPAYAQGPAWIGMKLSLYTNFCEPSAINYTNSYTSDSANLAIQNINDPDGRIATAPAGNVNAGWQRAGIYLGWSKSPDNPYKVPACVGYWTNYMTSTASSASAGALPNFTANVIKYASINETIPFTIYLQYEDDANSPGTWHTYQELRNLFYSRGHGGGDAFMEPGDSSWSSWLRDVTPPNSTNSLYTVTQLVYGTNYPSTYNGSTLANMDTTALGFLDPRTVRPNLWSWHNSVPYGRTGGTGSDSMITSTIAQIDEPSKGQEGGPHFDNPANLTDAVWLSVARTWIDNISILPLKNYDNVISATPPTSSYRDRDYIARVGDAAGWTNVVLPSDANQTTNNASPLSPGVQMQRPLHLDRPFRSVGELGYVFRDDPWKSINLISANSADSGLLDVFYIGSTNTATPTASAPDVIAGKININSAVQNVISAGGSPATSPVLQALVSQALRDYQSASGKPTVLDTAITKTSDVQALSTNIVSFMKTNGPFVNIADLPRVFPQVTGTTSAVPTPLYTGLKNPSEALIRAVADSSGTRTWNLMIDVIAQAGKFSPTAANLNNFTVEGEKHYWLHVAIDRFTGEIVDQQLEPVWE